MSKVILPIWEKQNVEILSHENEDKKGKIHGGEVIMVHLARFLLNHMRGDTLDLMLRSFERRITDLLAYNEVSKTNLITPGYITSLLHIELCEWAKED